MMNRKRPINQTKLKPNYKFLKMRKLSDIHMTLILYRTTLINYRVHCTLYRCKDSFNFNSYQIILNQKLFFLEYTKF